MHEGLTPRPCLQATIMSSFTDMHKEQHLANYLQELLSLDRARQQATLENLSRYADWLRSLGVAKENEE
eukprot:s762_g1.t1